MKKIKLTFVATLCALLALLTCSAQIIPPGGSTSSRNVYTNRLLTTLQGSGMTNRLWWTNATRAAFGNTNAIHVFTNSATGKWEWRTAFASLVATNDSNRATGTWHAAAVGAALYGYTRYEPLAATVPPALPSPGSTSPSRTVVQVNSGGVVTSPSNFWETNSASIDAADWLQYAPMNNLRGAALVTASRSLRLTNNYEFHVVDTDPGGGVNGYYQVGTLRDSRMAREGIPEMFSLKESWDVLNIVSSNYYNARFQDYWTVQAQLGTGSFNLDGPNDLAFWMHQDFEQRGNPSAFTNFFGTLTNALRYATNSAGTFSVAVNFVTNSGVYIPHSAYGTTGFGFQDTIKTEGWDLMVNVDRFAALNKCAEMASAAGWFTHASNFTYQANQVSNVVNGYLWDSAAGLFRNASISNRAHNLIGSARAVVVGIVPPARARIISSNLTWHSYTAAVAHGSWRQLPADETWDGGEPDGNLSNGGYWPGFAGWCAEAIALTNPKRAVELFRDLDNLIVSWPQNLSPVEYIDPTAAISDPGGGQNSVVGRYLQAAALPLEVFNRRLPGFKRAARQNSRTVITISAKGVSNGQSPFVNDLADFGPDTPGTTTCGIKEAWESVRKPASMGPEIASINLRFGDGIFEFSTPIVLSNKYTTAITLEGNGMLNSRLMFTGTNQGIATISIIGGVNAAVSSLDIPIHAWVKDLGFLARYEGTNVLLRITNASVESVERCLFTSYTISTNQVWGAGLSVGGLTAYTNVSQGLVGLQIGNVNDHLTTVKDTFCAGLATGLHFLGDHIDARGLKFAAIGHDGINNVVNNLWPTNHPYHKGFAIVRRPGLDAYYYKAHFYGVNGGLLVQNGNGGGEPQFLDHMQSEVCDYEMAVEVTNRTAFYYDGAGHRDQEGFAWLFNTNSGAMTSVNQSAYMFKEVYGNGRTYAPIYISSNSTAQVIIPAATAVHGATNAFFVFNSDNGLDGLWNYRAANNSYTNAAVVGTAAVRRTAFGAPSVIFTNASHSDLVSFEDVVAQTADYFLNDTSAPGGWSDYTSSDLPMQAYWSATSTNAVIHFGQFIGNGDSISNLVNVTSSGAVSGTVAMGNAAWAEQLYLSSGSTISSLTIALPSQTRAGQTFEIHTKSAITTLTVTGTTFIDSAVTSMSAGGNLVYRAIDNVGTYLRKQ